MDYDIRGNLAVHQEAAVRLLAMSQGSVDIGRRAPVHGSSGDRDWSTISESELLFEGV